jgi:hypothetical protein
MTVRFLMASATLYVPTTAMALLHTIAFRAWRTRFGTLIMTAFVDSGGLVMTVACTAGLVTPTVGVVADQTPISARTARRMRTTTVKELASATLDGSVIDVTRSSTTVTHHVLYVITQKRMSALPARLGLPW